MMWRQTEPENEVDDQEESKHLVRGRVLVVSDSHGRNGNLLLVMDRVKPDLILHLGDSEDDEDLIMDEAPCPVVMVRGNCDYGMSLPDEEIVTLGRHRVFLTHGHRHNVRFDLETLAEAALKYDCDTAIYGHTHMPEIEEENGVMIYNPGSISLPRQAGHKPSFMLLDVDKAGELHPAINYL